VTLASASTAVTAAVAVVVVIVVLLVIAAIIALLVYRQKSKDRTPPSESAVLLPIAVTDGSVTLCRDGCDPC